MSPTPTPTPPPLLKLTLIGTPFSTFTRTISLALHHKSLSFTQEVDALPQSALARAVHPFGYIPTLGIRFSTSASRGEEGDGKEVEEGGEGGKTIYLRETQAIIRYIDRVRPEPSLHLDPHQIDILPEKMWEFVSFVSCYGFPTIEHALVKPRLAHLAEGVLSPDAITSLLAPAIPPLHQFLSTLVSLLPPSSSTSSSQIPHTNSPSNQNHPKFLFTSHPTHADFHLLPLLADLRATPEWTAGVLHHPDAAVAQRIVRWMETMDGLGCVHATRAGTLEAQGEEGGK